MIPKRKTGPKKKWRSGDRLPPENKIEPEERQEAEYEVNDEQIFLDRAVSGACLARPALDRLRVLAYEGEIDIR